MPDGRYEDLEDYFGGHEEYARTFLVDRNDRRGLDAVYTKDYFAQKYKHILVSNAYNYFGPDPNSVKDEQWSSLVGGIADVLHRCGELPKDGFQTRVFYGYKDANNNQHTIDDRNIKRFLTALRQKKNLVQPRIDYSQLIQEAALSNDQIQKDLTNALAELTKLLQAAEEQAKSNPAAAEAAMGIAIRRRQQVGALMTHLGAKAKEAQEAVKSASQRNPMAEGIRLKIGQRSIHRDK